RAVRWPLSEGPLNVRPPGRLSNARLENAEAAAELLGALYGWPKRKEISGLEYGFDESLVLSVWMQQWPKLRRGFRFCTFSLGDRSLGSEIFDLQLVSKNVRVLRQR